MAQYDFDSLGNNYIFDDTTESDTIRHDFNSEGDDSVFDDISEFSMIWFDMIHHMTQFSLVASD